jgi:glycosyltransferase involved in cell wall biosynthesis
MSGLTAVLPCYNEGAQVDRAYDAIVTALGRIDELELLIVDDGSTDDTLARVKALAASDPRVHYLSFTRNFGLEAAQSAGFGYAAHPWTVQLDADLQSPPDEALRLLAKAAEGYDVVYGIRADRRDPWHRRLGSAGVHWVGRRLLGIALPPGASTFRVVRTAVARTVVAQRAGTPYFIAQLAQAGARYACVPVRHAPRTGRSKWRLSRLFGHGFELFFGYSWRPLNAVYALALAGLLAGLTGLVLLAAGAATVAAAMLLLVCLLTLVAVALTARYLHRMLREVRPRLYYVRESNLPLNAQDTLDGGEPAVAPPGAAERVPT